MQKKKEEINDLLKKHNQYKLAAADKNYEGNQHERMSAYYILTDSTLKKNIHTLCVSFHKKYIADAVDDSSEEVAYSSDVRQKDALDFICRMITGTHYDVPTNYNDYNADLEYSMRNCVIAILNGTIDADSMDYIMRNSYSSGYETSEVDHYRFCNALTVYTEQGQMFPAWRKSALSVIEGFINARNYEPRWLYSHHKVVYQDVLLKEMLIDAVKYMAHHTSMPLEDADRRREWIYYPFFTYVLSPFVPFSSGRYIFYQSVDGDIENFFKQIALEMKQQLRRGNPSEDDGLICEYLRLYEESSTRCHKKSLWKSFAEYKQALSTIAHRLDTNFDTVNRYTLELIQKGLMQKTFHLCSGESDDGHSPARHYESEIIYYPRSREEQAKMSLQKGGVNGLISQHIPKIFHYFDPDYCRVKIVCPRTKDFSKEQVLLGGRHYALTEMLEWEKGQRPNFPYLFYSLPDGEPDGVDLKEEFFSALEDYCRRRITDLPVGGNMVFHAKGGKFIRDVVHGDIFLPDRFLAVVETPEFQRLRRIKQLATATQVFPNAGHSRFSHSLGTYYVMTKIVEHFEGLCAAQGMQLFHNRHERDVVLLSALLHDLGHGPYSHAFEHITGNKSHEEWTSSIILDPTTRLNAVLRYQFEDDTPQRIVECINHQTASPDNFSFADIYPTLISSQLDADRLDYLMRDSYNTAIQFGNLDLQNLISAMRITVIGQKYSVAMDETQLSMVEHFLFGRFKMYETVYYNAYKLFSEELFQRIFRRVRFLIEESSRQGDRDSWRKDMESSEAGKALYAMLTGAELNVREYLLLDDAAIESQFARWQNKEDPILIRLIQAFLHRNQLDYATMERSPLADRADHEIFRRIRVFHEKDAEVQDLLRQIEALLRMEGVSLSDPHRRLEDASCAFISMKRCCKMYYGSGNPDTDGNVIWLLRENGTVEDIGNVSLMLGDSFHKSYLYYCEDIFWEELKHCALPEDKKDIIIDRILRGVKELMEASHPRNMIEIEEKYSCEQQTLEEIRDILEGYTKASCGAHEGFYLKLQEDGSTLQVIEQEDTYYDLAGDKLHKSNCSLRCRRIKGKNGVGKDGWVFTIKRPTDSKNFDGNEQFARFEFEMKADSDELNGTVAHFINSHLDFPGLLGVAAVSDEEIQGLLRPVLTITNHRLKGTVCRKVDDQQQSPFKAEVCLDSVIYKNSLANFQETGKLDWQIELELKSDYLDRVLLKKFTSLLRSQNGLASRLVAESASKYTKARQLLNLIPD